MKRFFLTIVVLLSTSLAAVPLEQSWQQKNGLARLVFAAGKLSGHAGCNALFASYQTNGSSIEISGVATTKIACEKTRMSQEAIFLTALDGVKRFFVSSDGQRLTLLGKSALRFVIKSNP